MRNGRVMSSSTTNWVSRCVASTSTSGFDKGSDPFQNSEDERRTQQCGADQRPEVGHRHSQGALQDHDPGKPADLLQQGQHPVSMPRLVNGWW
jgi:hypothetical protein